MPRNNPFLSTEAPASIAGLAERRRRWPPMLADFSAAFVLIACLLLAGSLVAVNRDAADRASRQSAMIAATQRLISTVTAAQSSERGYVLTGDPSFLLPYRQAAGNLEGIIGELRLSYREADRSDADVDAVAEPARRELARAERVIAARDTQRFQAAAEMVRSGEGKRLMDDLRRAAAAEIDRAQSAMRDDVVAVDNNNWIQLLAALVALGASTALSIIATRRYRRQKRTHRLIDDLIDNAPVGIGFLDGDLNLLRRNELLADLVEDGDGRPFWSTGSTLGDTLSPWLHRVVAEGLPLADFDVAVFARRSAGNETARTAEGPSDGQDPKMAVASADTPLRSLRITAFPIANGDADAGSGERVVGLIAVDVSDGWREQSGLARTESRFRSFVEATASIVWSAHPSGRFVEPQPAWMAFTGQSEDEHLEDGWLDAVHPGDRETTLRIRAESLAEKSSYAFRHRVRRADGAWRDMAVRGVPILGAQGQVVEWIGTHTDVAT